MYKFTVKEIIGGDYRIYFSNHPSMTLGMHQVSERITRIVMYADDPEAIFCA